MFQSNFNPRYCYVLGIHLPILLYMKEDKKGEICQDILDSRAIKNANVELLDSSNNEIRQLIRELPAPEIYFKDGDISGERLYPVDVHQLFIPNTFELGHEITAECLAVERNADGKPSIVSYLVAYAFRKRSYFVTKKMSAGARLLGLAELAPEYVEFTQEELEKYYLRHRLPLGECLPKNPL